MQEDEGSDLLEAALANDKEACLEAIMQGADVNVQDSNGDTALHIAASWGYVELVEVLLEQGSSILTENNFRMTPLHLAAIGGYAGVLAVLFDHALRTEEKVPDNIIDEILYVAAEAGAKNKEIEELFLAYHAGESMSGYGTGGRFDDMLLSSCESGDYEKVKAALASGASPDARDEHETSALRWASRKGHVNVVRLLLDSGAEVNEHSRTGWTPLMEACTEGFAEIVSLLIENGALIDAKTYINATALILASKGGYENIVRILLDHGANTGVRIKRTSSDSGKTALDVAISNGYEEIARLIRESNQKRQRE